MTSKCAFPPCKNEAVTTYCQIPLCKKHHELALFIRFIHYEIDKQDEKGGRD